MPGPGADRPPPGAPLLLSLLMASLAGDRSPSGRLPYGDRYQAHVRATITVTDRVREGVHTLEANRVVGHRPVAVVGHATVAALGDCRYRQGVAVRVGVIGQDIDGNRQSIDRCCCVVDGQRRTVGDTVIELEGPDAGEPVS